MKRKKTIGSICLLLVLLLIVTSLFAGCGVNASGNDSNYSTITNVDGVSFDVYGNVLKGASFVSAISDSDLLNNAQTFIYRDEISEYLIYNSTSYAVVCQRINPIGINNMSSSDIKTYFSTLSFLKSSVTTSSKKISFKKGESNGMEKLYFPSIEVGISPNVYSYQNYYGSMSYIETPEYGFIIFMGVTTPLEEVTKEVKKVIEHTTKSITYIGVTNTTEEEEDFFVVSGVSDNNQSESIEHESIVQNEQETEDSEEVTVEEATEEEVTIEEQPTEEQTTPVEIITPEIHETPDYADVSTEEVEIEIDESVIEEIIEPTLEPEEHGEAVEIIPEKLPNVETKKVLASISCTAYSKNPSGTDVSLSVYEINPKADSIIVADTGFNIRVGTHLESIDYKIESLDEDYQEVVTAIKLKGLDKEKLTYMGIKYSSKTYSYNTDGYVRCYYEVPNGCNEYLLEIGNPIGTISSIHIKSGKIEK